MQAITLYRRNQKVSTWGEAGAAPLAVVRVPHDAMVDPAKDVVYLDTPEGVEAWRPGTLLLAARSAMFGIVLAVPEPEPKPTPRRPAARKRVVMAPPSTPDDSAASVVLGSWRSIHTADPDYTE